MEALLGQSLGRDRLVARALGARRFLVKMATYMPMPSESVLRIKAVLPNVPRAIDFVTHLALEAGFGEQALYEIQVAVDEACANIVHHAYGDKDHGDMELACKTDDRMFVICVRDWGESFAPEEIADPNVHAPLDERSLGGLGLFLIRQFMDELHFAFDREQGNELIMSKKLPAAD